jgi:hypothetical protein
MVYDDMPSLLQALTFVRASFRTTFHHLSASTVWLWRLMSWPVVAWLVGACWAFGGLMVRADEFSLAQVIFLLGNVLLLFKFVTWKELHLNPVVQRLMIILFAVVTMSGLSVIEVRWIDDLRPIPPDILAMPDRPGSNTMVLLVSNHKTNIEGVRVKILEHTQRNDPMTLLRQFEQQFTESQQYKDLGTVQPYSMIPIGKIQLTSGPDDIFQVNAITPIGKFMYMLYFRRKANNTWEEEYVALYMNGKVRRMPMVGRPITSWWELVWNTY